MGGGGMNVASLQCQAGANDRDSCLSEAKIDAIGKMASPTSYGFPLNSGVTGFSGWPVLLGADTSSMYGATGKLADSQSGSATLAFVRYFITRDAATDPLTHEPDEFAQTYSAVSERFDTLSTDLNEFRQRGGKLLWLHGSVDYRYPHSASEEYWGRLVKANGEDFLREFVRFYLVPGFGHGSGTFNVSWDSLSVLEEWVENDVAPQRNALVVADGNSATKGRTRPLCDYPAWPRYTGSGDPDAASSFACVDQ